MLSPRDVKSVQDAKNIVEARGLSHVKVGVFDIDGVMRGKYMSKEKFFSSLDHGFGFCDVIFGWDSKDQLYDNTQYTGWHSGYPDLCARILPDTCRSIPFEGDMLLFVAELAETAESICPRAVLRQVIERAANQGMRVIAAFEYEFFLFNESPESVRKKGFRGLSPITPDYFGYSMIRNSVHAERYHQILSLCHEMDFPIEGLHTETGAGVLEAALVHDDALSAADKAALFKTFIKVWAQRQEMMATFMAKWSVDWPGQSGHIHLSLQDNQGQSLFYDEQKSHNMSDCQRHFIAGQQRYMPEFMAMVAPTVNSYSRMVPGFWAPMDATWGVENRTTALRVIPGTEKSQRVEYRLGAADANPYLALAAALASGLRGIEQQLEPKPQITGNAYEQQHPPELALPASLGIAAERLSQSDSGRDLFGDAFVEHFSATRVWEEREYRKHISDWELQRYFEII